ncbi:hypothetical protein H0E87_017130 [Populus deltoides]|uniref:Uncharacterized protein n=1 Tax=Populus deltoides TaxID=3696 RepID=A0A8T2XZ39_POPDE|nr:hypothetical protein H0E87_017130 [Populus deltoides]
MSIKQAMVLFCLPFSPVGGQVLAFPYEVLHLSTLPHGLLPSSPSTYVRIPKTWRQERDIKASTQIDVSCLVISFPSSHCDLGGRVSAQFCVVPSQFSLSSVNFQFVKEGIFILGYDEPHQALKPFPSSGTNKFSLAECFRILNEMLINEATT